MKVSISLGVTLNLGNYNSGRVAITFDDEYAEKELEIYTASADQLGLPSDHKTIRTAMADDLYKEVEDILMSKISDFIMRLEDEKLV